MVEPNNVFGIGKYHGSVALGKGVHRMMSSKQALELAYWLIKVADVETPEQIEAASQVMDLLLRNARGEHQI